MTQDERDRKSPRPVSRARETGTALDSHYRFILWLVPAVERFPRRRKFLLGDRIQTTALDVLERTMIRPTAESAQFLGFLLLPGGGRRLPEDNVRRFRNRRRGLRERWRHGSVA